MKNILLIVVDTLRPDHLGCYGYDRPTSPNLDALAGRGHVLQSLWSASNFTAPAFTSLFTGRYPHHHGIFDFTAQARHSDLFDLLKANDADCGGVVAFRFFRNLLKDIWGDIEAVTDTRSFNFAKTLPMDVTDGALDWLDARAEGDRPFCLFVHYDGPHMPFRLPDDRISPFDDGDTAGLDPALVEQLLPLADQLDTARNKTSMYNMVNDVNWGRRKLDPATLQWVVNKYDASVLYNDEAIGRLLDGLGPRGLADDTVIAVLSDHGEEFMEHGGFTHGGAHLYEEIVRTVGIIHDPAAPGGGQPVAGPASQVDILPTLLKLAGADHLPAAVLDRAIPLDGSGKDRPPVFCHGKFKTALRDGAHKLIISRPHATLGPLARLKLWLKMALQRKLGLEIFDLEQDPVETRNLAGDKALRRRLTGLMKSHLAAAPPAALDIGAADDAERARIEQEMKDLGYM